MQTPGAGPWHGFDQGCDGLRTTALAALAEKDTHTDAALARFDRARRLRTRSAVITDPPSSPPAEPAVSGMTRY